MRALPISVKIFIGALGIGSFVALAESVHDREFYSSAFMDQEAPIDFKIVENPEIKQRIVASQLKKLPKIQKVEMNRASSIDGKWEITRILDAKKNVVYDVFQREEDANDKIVVDFELIQVSTLRINEDQEQVYKISLLTEANTIVLFKEFGKGYEIIEARKVLENKIDESSVLREQKESIVAKKVQKNSIKFHIDREMILASALDPARDRRVLKVNQIEGTAELKNGELYLNRVVLHKGSQKETESFDIEGTVVTEYGYFEYEHSQYGKLQGVVTTIGSQEIKIRFTNGPLANSYLNFVTSDKYSELKIQQEENLKADADRSSQRENEAFSAQSRARQAQQVQVPQEGSTPRREGTGAAFYGQEELSQANEPSLTEEEMAAMAEREGFSL